jgi:hypothetical protein
MARTKTIIDFKKLSHLKKMTEHKFGRSIVTSKDCIDLTHTLTSSIHNHHISPQTIRRLYGLIKTDFYPSLYTLDILAHYVANTCWANYNFVDDAGENLNSTAEWIYNYYANAEFGITEVADAIASSEELQNLLVVKLAKINTAHWMFFEHRPLRDCLNKSFKNALLVYIHEKDTTEAEIFGYGLLFIGAFLSENTKEIEEYFVKMERTPLTKDVYNIPAARKFGVPLIYYHLKGDEVNFNKVMEESLEVREKYVDKMDYYTINFDYSLVEHLILIGRFEECALLWKLHQRDKQTRFPKKPVSKLFEQLTLLFEAFIYGRKKNYSKILEFDCNGLRIGERKYYNLMFLSYMIKFTKKNSSKKLEKLYVQFYELIEDTGYTYFNKLIH